MANTLTNLIPTLYQSLDKVSREQVGLIPAVNLNASGANAALNESINVPVTVAESAYDITAGLYAPDNGDTTPGNVVMTINKSKMVPVRFNGEEMRGLNNGLGASQLVTDRFTQAMRTLTNLVEADIAGQHVYASRAYGTAGTTPFASTIGDSAQVRKILEDNGQWFEGSMGLVVNSAAGANLRTLGQLTKANEAGSDMGLRRGALMDLNGFMLGQSSQIITSVAGTGALATTNTAGYAVGATVITLASAGTGTIVAGDCITFAGDTNVYVVASGDTDVSNGGTITLAAPGLKKALAASAIAITLVAASARNMAFEKNAIQLITRAPAMPDGGDGADDVMNITDPLSGITYQVAVYKQYRQVKYEIGLAWGVKTVKAEGLALLLG